MLRALLKGRARRVAFRALAKCAATKRSMDLITDELFAPSRPKDGNAYPLIHEF
jgi:hypothetical protein